MNNIEILIEEQRTLKDKITSAMKELKQWFLDKIDNMKEFLRELKTKIVDTFKVKVAREAVVSSDISFEGEILFKKGTPVSRVTSEIGKHLGEVNKNTDLVIRHCKGGIVDISRRKNQEAIEKKRKVIAGIKRTLFLTKMLKQGLRAYKTAKMVKEFSKMMDQMPSNSEE